MVLLESVCAAAFSAGSAVCLVKLLLPQQQAANNNNLFVATLLVTCLMGAFALCTVKGTHACWHPSSGPPWSSSSSPPSSTAATATVRARQHGGEYGRIGVGRAAKQKRADKAETAAAAGGEMLPAESAAAADDIDPALCDGILGADEGPPLEVGRLERQSSFVVSLIYSLFFLGRKGPRTQRLPAGVVEVRGNRAAGRRGGQERAD